MKVRKIIKDVAKTVENIYSVDVYCDAIEIGMHVMVREDGIFALVPVGAKDVVDEIMNLEAVKYEFDENPFQTLRIYTTRKCEMHEI